MVGYLGGVADISYVPLWILMASPHSRILGYLCYSTFSCCGAFCLGLGQPLLPIWVGCRQRLWLCLLRYLSPVCPGASLLLLRREKSQHLLSTHVGIILKCRGWVGRWCRVGPVFDQQGKGAGGRSSLPRMFPQDPALSCSFFFFFLI